MVAARAGKDLGPAFDEPARTLDRRQLIRAGVWAAPVIVLATAVPAAAASGDPVPAQASAGPSGYTANPTPGSLAPDLVLGGSSALGVPYYGAGIDYGKPTYRTNIYVKGVPNGVATPLKLRYIIPATADPLKNATSAPATWAWTATGGNFTNFVATWYPSSPSGASGAWELSLTSAQWNGGETYLQLQVVAP